MTTLNTSSTYATHNAWNTLQIPTNINGVIVGNVSEVVVNGQTLNGEYVSFVSSPTVKVRSIKVNNVNNASLMDTALEVKVVQEVTIKKNKTAKKARTISITLQTEIFRTEIASHTNIWLD